uniref:PX domain-containing protein n=1 Tax=Neobodo designis TaxID=312471 RepID=A0A6U4YAE1_NEODS|mmetsp:Transcript_7208/g.22560  ORF Transcript_7208/g.22560 Transcript_7208/m.22560 type:complete len:240 (+) Transcript_7208:168-887(+)|eukprot:CAMPEP_0174835542 /NCGR_PEP_ID=MMETSP1114-20130205/5460_1 /TAXON_ID=312471 /ORGANISM="Neobodo designis, Strain CCAP 1951/1" /LENGTH=239 /DNA_ID=CAMNT_0016069493 /DNA_START=146 /DNA_END=865 /DNA_ORIENTATION=+
MSSSAAEPSPEAELAELREQLSRRDAELNDLRMQLEEARTGDRSGSISHSASEPLVGDATATPASSGTLNGPNAEGDRAALQELAALRQQVESMKAMLPILTVPNFTFSLVPSTSEGGGKEVAVYEIVVNYGENVYAVYRRYSEFRALHERLEHDFKDKELLPRFPGRQGLFRSTNNNSKAIERRKRELQTYIRQLVASDEVRNSQHVRNFFAQLALDPTGGDGYEASIPHTASDDGEF